MSMDNGYVIQKNSKGKFTLQMYFASADEFPAADSAPEDETFDTLEEAALKYEELEDQAIEGGYLFCEYGLSIRTREPS